MKRWGVLAGILLVVVLGAAVAWQGPWFRSEPVADAPESPPGPEPDPRLVYTGPFKNVHPDVKFIGDDRCAECHPEILTSYRKHAMGHSLMPIEQTTDQEIYQKKYINPFTSFDSLLFADQDGKDYYHRQTRLDQDEKKIYEATIKVRYLVGSGKHAKSYLFTRGDGYLFMSPMTYYGQKKIWDITPGYPRHLLKGRPVVHECLFCHSNKAEPIEGTLNRFKEPIFHGHSIGCERCHGPGQLHYDYPGEMKPIIPSEFIMTDVNNPRKADLTIVNPRHLPMKLRDAVCEQCHLEGEAKVRRLGRGIYDFRPGLPLDKFWSIFVSTREMGGEDKIVNHVEQMHLSECWKKTSEPNKLGCISCHNPHGVPTAEKRVSFYRQRCLNCHDGTKPNQDRVMPECALPVDTRLQKNKQDSCIDCHMPHFRPEELVHGAFTNHRVLRYHNKIPKYIPPPEKRTKLPLVHFHHGIKAETDSQLRRDLGIALAHYSTIHTLERPHLFEALNHLDHGLKHRPKDVAGWEHKALLLDKLEYYKEALEAYEHPLKHGHAHEACYEGAARMAQKVNQLDLAISYAHKAVELNPWDATHVSNLAGFYSMKNEWKNALKYCKKARELDPESLNVRRLWVQCLLHHGRTAEAEAEVAILRRMDPPAADAYLEWFQEQKEKAK